MIKVGKLLHCVVQVIMYYIFLTTHAHAIYIYRNIYNVDEFLFFTPFKNCISQNLEQRPVNIFQIVDVSYT